MKSFGLQSFLKIHLFVSLQALKANQVWPWQRKAYRDREDRMANPDFQALMVHKYYQTIKILPTHNQREKILFCLICFYVAFPVTR